MSNDTSPQSGVDADGESYANDGTDDRNGFERPTDKQDTFVAYLQWSLFVVLLLVALVSTFRLYVAGGQIITEFVTDRYRPLFRAGFNLAVLLVAGLGLSVLTRRMA